jgi:methionine aminopeptidase
MSIRSNSKLKKLQAIGKIARAALDEMSEAVAPVSRPVERKVRLCGFSAMREFCGHGIGRSVHENQASRTITNPGAESGFQSRNSRC